jgi:hypothetical protein
MKFRIDKSNPKLVTGFASVTYEGGSRVADGVKQWSTPDSLKAASAAFLRRDYRPVRVINKSTGEHQTTPEADVGRVVHSMYLDKSLADALGITDFHTEGLLVQMEIEDEAILKGIKSGEWTELSPGGWATWDDKPPSDGVVPLHWDRIDEITLCPPNAAMNSSARIFKSKGEDIRTRLATHLPPELYDELIAFIDETVSQKLAATEGNQPPVDGNRPKSKEDNMPNGESKNVNPDEPTEPTPTPEDPKPEDPNEDQLRNQLRQVQKSNAEMRTLMDKLVAENEQLSTSRRVEKSRAIAGTLSGLPGEAETIFELVDLLHQSAGEKASGYLEILARASNALIEGASPIGSNPTTKSKGQSITQRAEEIRAKDPSISRARALEMAANEVSK